MHNVTECVKVENGGREGVIQIKNQGSGIRLRANYYNTEQKVILENEKTLLQSIDKIATFNSHIGIQCKISLGGKKVSFGKKRGKKKNKSQNYYDK